MKASDYFSFSEYTNSEVNYEDILKRMEDYAEAKCAELKEKVNELTMTDMTHEYNQAEAERFRPHFEEQMCVEFYEWVQRHPSYSIWNKTGEELYRAFLKAKSITQ